MTMQLRYIGLISFAFGYLVLVRVAEGAPIGPNPAAIAEVTAGSRTDANASWWGFNPADATDTLQAAIDSKAKSVVVPYMGSSWIVRPIKLRGDLELVFDPGVVVLAKRGEYKAGGDSLFSAADCENIAIRGYGATLRMWKKDYQSPPYEKAEWRMGIDIVGCRNVLIEGVRVESTGGDGIYIGTTSKNRWSEKITIRNCVALDNHRQGISVISAQDLLIENCEFSGTSGTAPQAGIDFEPNRADERLVNCIVRNCVFRGNAGAAMQVYLKPLDATSQPLSIRFENCLAGAGAPDATPDELRAASVKGGAGIAVGAIKDDGPQGVVEFVNCTVESAGREAVTVYDKSSKSATVRFDRCQLDAPWVAVTPEDAATRASIVVSRNRPSTADIVGGVEFVDCVVHDDQDRPVLKMYGMDDAHGVTALAGSIWLHAPHAPRVELGPNPSAITLQVQALAVR
ncbi:MAG: right-handed parallel beta-helix repeat-containing protein [Candidatus Hydrogenedentes bacterium]|nr:right-handed parallel beta-helix repeat-containing protein [Candidatus Hydrogenedentota bacterium]